MLIKEYTQSFLKIFVIDKTNNGRENDQIL